jgi:DNA mismatch repair protein MutL
VRRTLLSFHTAPGEAHAAAPGIPPIQPGKSIEPAVAVPTTKDLPQLLPPPPARPITNRASPSPANTPNAPSAAPPAIGQRQPTSDTPRSAVRVAHSPAPPVSSAVVPLLKVPLRLVGVVGRLYVVLESDRGLVLMDQHAAHERILYEQMLRRLEQGDAPSQRLLLPETVELSPRDAQFLREHLPVLGRLGVGLSEFGERTFLLDALPPFVKVSDARRFVLELIDELVAAGREVNSFRLGEQTVAKTVCRHAVKANDPLAVPELENLLNDLRNCAMPYTCPHGRPTLIEMNYRELEKKFGRTQ